jgi:glyoxylase I family protein
MTDGRPGSGRLIGRLGLVNLVAADLPRSTHFYSDLLGLQLTASTERWVELDAGNIRLGLHAANDQLVPNLTSGCSLGFYVDDVEGTTAELSRLGAHVAREPFRNEFGNVFSVILDPDGYRIQLVEV